jgi:hypothetical protein
VTHGQVTVFEEPASENKELNKVLKRFECFVCSTGKYTRSFAVVGARVTSFLFLL